MTSDSELKLQQNAKTLQKFLTMILEKLDINVIVLQWQ